MNEDLANIHYSPVWDYKYAQWFEEVQYNGKTLSDAERKEFVAVIDETIAQYSEGLSYSWRQAAGLEDSDGVPADAAADHGNAFAGLSG